VWEFHWISIQHRILGLFSDLEFSLKMSTFAEAIDIFESAVTIRQQEVSLSSSETVAESHAGTSKRKRVASIKMALDDAVERTKEKKRSRRDDK